MFYANIGESNRAINPKQNPPILIVRRNSRLENNLAGKLNQRDKIGNSRRVDRSLVENELIRQAKLVL